MKQMEGIFELFDLSVRRLANGNKLRIVLECVEDLDVEKKLIEFRGENVKAMLAQQSSDGKQAVNVEDVFEVFDIKCRRLRNGDKLSFILEQLYEKEKEIELVKLRYDNVKIFMEKIQDQLFNDEDEMLNIDYQEETE